MVPMRRRLVAIAIIGTLLAASGSSWASTASAIRRKRHPKHPVKAVLPPPPVPIPLPPPLPAYPVHDPAVPPQVSYVNGQLLIDARNSTLSDVLKAVEKRTGAAFDISSGDTSERVVGRIGPGSARDVMAELLNGSHFNYVMQAVAQTYTAQQQPPQFQQPVQISPAQVDQNVSADESTENADTSEESADNQNQYQTDAQPEAQTDAAQTGQPPQQAPGVKTPEQLLQELRQQQQQIIQQQQVPQPGQVPPDDNK